MHSSSTPTSTRRELLRSFAIFGTALIASCGLIACASDDDASGQGGLSKVDPTDETDPTEGTGGALVRCEPPVISDNHGHSLIVSSDDVAAGVTKTYSIKGTSGHDHEVTITSAEFDELAAGQSITVVSTDVSGHTHDVTIQCAKKVVTPDAGTDAKSDGGASKPDASNPNKPDASKPDAAYPPEDDASTPPPPPPPPPPPTCSQGAKASSISSNHGHVLVVPQADIATGTTKTYAIKGTSSHSHDVTLTAAQLGQLSGGGTITVSSSTGASHTHTVVVICA